MKPKVTLILFLFSLGVSAQFNNDEDLTASVFVDPTFTDEGFQFGIQVRKELIWGWVGIEASHYGSLNPPYTDIVGSGGMALEFKPVSILLGPRAGVMYRGQSPYPLIGLISIFEIQIIENVRVGFRLWVDHREDQKDQFYGDSDAYTPGLIFTGPLAQENGAAVLTWIIQ